MIHARIVRSCPPQDRRGMSLGPLVAAHTETGSTKSGKCRLVAELAHNAPSQAHFFALDFFAFAFLPPSRSISRRIGSLPGWSYPPSATFVSACQSARSASSLGR